MFTYLYELFYDRLHTVENAIKGFNKASETLLKAAKRHDDKYTFHAAQVVVHESKATEHQEQAEKAHRINTKIQELLS